MKRKKTYVFEEQMFDGKILDDADAIELILNEMKGMTLPEQLTRRGVRFVLADNRVKEYGYVNTMHSPKARSCLAPISGFRPKDFLPQEHNFIVGLNVGKHKKSGKFISPWSLSLTLGHELAHTWQMDAKNWQRRGYYEIGHLSIGMSYKADEQFCWDFAEAWLCRGDNFEEAKEMLGLHRQHGDFSRVFRSHISTFTV